MHKSVLLAEVIEGLAVKPGEWYIDATFGAGGHSTAIADHGGHVVAIDQDPQTAAFVKKESGRVKLMIGNFAQLKDLVAMAGVGQVQGVLYDLGVSSMQLDQGSRGFSFREDAPLDMRMSQNLQVTAKDLVNHLEEKELYAIFTKYAQEQRARAIAHAIVRARRIKPIDTTGQLARVVEEVYRGRRGKLHPATKIFQALRIVVNQELENLVASLPQAVELLKSGGRLAVISFHEGEDRAVKRFFNTQAANEVMKIITKKPIIPSREEIVENSRSRSAKLRIAEKL